MTYYDNNTKEELRIHKAEVEGGKEILPMAVANPVICGTPTLMFCRRIFESIGGTWIAGIGNEMSDWALGCRALKQGWKVADLKESYLRIYINHDGVRMSDPRFYENNAERYIKFHTHFLTEYTDVIKEHPKAGIFHYQNLMRYYASAGLYGKAYGIWKKLLIANFSPKSLALFPYTCFRNLFSKK